MTDIQPTPDAAQTPTNGSMRRFVEITGPGRPAVLRVRNGVIRIGREADNDIVIDDPFVSRHHLEIHVTPEKVVAVDLGTRNGSQCEGRLIHEFVVLDEAVLLLGRQACLRIQVADETKPNVVRRSGLVGDSIAMERLRTLVGRVAPTNLTALIDGETGTGKEVVAQTIHSASGRERGPFVVFDCGSVSPQLLAAELFGHTKGAFTGASGATEGAFRRAQGGTLFLDEIGELPLDLQPALLRALESREIRPVGGDAYVPVDVRVIAATNRSLEDEVTAGRFRRDLMFRLAVARIRVPSLRQRVEDVPMLATHFAGRLGATLAQEVLDQLSMRQWPGNVRELRNAVETAVMLAGPARFVASLADSDLNGFDEDATSPVTRGELAVAASSMNTLEPGVNFHDAKQKAVDAFEREYLARLLADASYNLSEASRRSGVDRGHLRELCRKHHLEPSKFRAAARHA